jgi:hypothetical protein
MDAFVIVEVILSITVDYLSDIDRQGHGNTLLMMSRTNDFAKKLCHSVKDGSAKI